MAKTRNKSSDIKKQPTEKQLAARAKFALVAKNRGKVKTEGKYKLSVYFNDSNQVCITDDLKEALLSLNPSVVKTRVRVILESEGKKAEKMLFVIPAKRVFRNPISAGIFTKSLLASLK